MGNEPPIILLAEDEASLRTVVARSLTGSGYKVIQAASGQEALDLSKSNAFDLLITDVVMPEISGPQLAASLTGSRGLFPTIYMSGYPDDFLGTLQPNERFIKKPFPAQDLVRCVQEALAIDPRSGD